MFQLEHPNETNSNSYIQDKGENAKFKTLKKSFLL